VSARPRPDAEASDPFGFFAKPEGGLPTPPMPTMDELLRQMLSKLQDLTGGGNNDMPGAPSQNGATSAPAIPAWRPKPVTGYRIPIMPPREKSMPAPSAVSGGTPTAGTANAFGYADIQNGANRFTEGLRQEALQRTLKGEAVRFDPLSGIQPVTEAERILERPGAVLRQGPLYGSHRGNVGPLGKSNLGDIGLGDLAPGINTVLSLDDLAAMWAREDAGLDVGIGEKAGTYLGVVPIPGIRPLSKPGGKLLDRVIRRLGRKVDTSILERVAKEGIPVAENAAEGKAAVVKALSGKTRVPAGMYRPDLGEIAMDYGVAGDPAHDFQGGYGLSHIIERRKLLGEDGEAIVREIVPDVLAKGRVIEQPALKSGPPRIAVSDGGHKVFLEKRQIDGRQTWVVTSFSSRNEGGVLPRLPARGRQEAPGAEDVSARGGVGQPVGAADAGAASKTAFTSKPLLTELPEFSYTVNPMQADEFRKLPQRGKVNPHRIRTSQDTNEDKFRLEKGDEQKKSVLEMANELRTIPGKEDKISEIRIFERDGKVYSLDHRRLVSHRLAEMPIRFRTANPREIKREMIRKFSTKDDGMSIRIVPAKD
jgi:phage-Barnase-EndoU-ColicinE5/D-RelE like nuclease1